MAARRTRIARVKAAGWAAVCAGAAAIPLSLALVGDERAAHRDGPARVTRVATVADERGPHQPTVMLDLPEGPASTPNLLAQLAALREAGDVASLLGCVEAARGARDPALARVGVLALASLGAVPGAEAQEALRGVVLGSQRPQLERTTALAALWRRGDRAFVDAHGRDSSEPALRSKARALRRAAERAE